MTPRLVLAWCLLLAGAALAQDRCGVEAPCEVATGTYRAVPPPEWDGRTPIPTAVFFHGAHGSAAEGLANEQLLAEFAAAGTLLILPDGIDGGWAFRGGWRQGRDDVTFTRDVLADIRARWPIEEQMLFASGFSLGGSMVWHLACHAGLFRAHVPVGGDFWEPYPQSCPTGPIGLLHIHGLYDATFPLEGRSFRGGFVQGNLFDSFGVLLNQGGCQRHPVRMESVGGFMLRSWAGACRSGSTLAMALYPGGHSLPEGWVPLAMDWLRALP